MAHEICISNGRAHGLACKENFMADPLLAMIGGITLAFLGIVATASLVVLAVQAGLALARTITGLFARSNKS